jgi:hypothetical protein
MKQASILFALFLFSGQIYADIAPLPIVVKGIYTVNNCRIEMTSEYVEADLYNDSATVVCTFNLLNRGDSTTIEVGFPEMNFQYFSSMGHYDFDDRTHFNICVDGKSLNEEDIKVPEEMDSIYKKSMFVYSADKEERLLTDSIYKANGIVITSNGTVKYPSSRARKEARKAIDKLLRDREARLDADTELWFEFNAQMRKGNFPWYVWNVHFEKGEEKTIRVVYSLPSGIDYIKRGRYFKYILETGAGWYGAIGSADVCVRLPDISTSTLGNISPAGYRIDYGNKTITWEMKDLEPTEKDDIYVGYYNPSERK